MIAVVLSAHPGEHQRTRAGIDLAMTLATFETPFELFFTGPAAACLAPSDLPKSPARLLASLPLYGLEQWYVDQSLPEMISGTRVVSPETLREHIRQCDQVIRV